MENNYVGDILFSISLYHKCGCQPIYKIKKKEQNIIEAGEMKEKSYIHEDEYYYSIIRKNVKKFRLEHGLTQQELADLTDMSREYICDIENEKRNKHLTIAVLGRIADALGVNITKFFQK